MDRRDDERMPDELKEAGEWMREARTEPTPLQLDELKQRAHRQAARRKDAGVLGGLGARWRIRAVTTLLVVGLMMTSLTGVVLATGGGSSSLNNLLQLLSNWTNPPKDPSHSQYCPPKPHSVSYTTTTSGGHHNDDDDDGDDCIPCPPKTMTAKTSGGSNHHGDDDDDGDDCDPCKSSTATSKTSGGGSHPSDPCDPCKSSSAGSKTYTNGGSHNPCDPKPGCGPDKTNGTAGNSGTHQGQPPKDQNRGDCPKKPPTASTGSASNITKYAAKLSGTVNPNGKATTGYIEWGKSSPGTTAGSTSLGSGTSAKSVSASISNLSKNTKYYFRVVGKSADGTTNGATASFTTAK